MKQLRVYQKAVEFYRACKAVRCDSDLKRQLMKASSSIALNIAEGYGKLSQADRHRFYRIAFGSTRECQSIMELLSNPTLADQVDHIAAMMWKLLKSS